MKTLHRVALIHWSLLNGFDVSREEFIFCVRYVHGKHKGSVGSYITKDINEVVDDSLYQHQPRTHFLIQQWRDYFSQPKSFSEALSTRFILDIHNSLEEVDSLFSNLVTAGVTKRKRNNLNDLLTKRPNIKVGWTLQLTSKGSGSYNCIRQQLITQPGDLVLLSPDALYDYCREPSCDEWIHHWFYFPADEALLPWLRWPEVGPNIYHLKSSAGSYRKLTSIFDEAIALFVDNQPHSDALRRNLLEQILIRCKSFVKQQPHGAMDTRISKATTYIAHNFDKNFSIEQLAADVGLSTARLSSLFKQQTGTSILRWRDERRMARASQLLMHTRHAVNVIAEMVGYTDALYFTRCFKQHLGCSPKNYRNKSQGLSDD